MRGFTFPGSFLYILKGSAKLRVLRAYAPTSLTHRWSGLYSSLTRVYALRALISTISAWRAFFVLCCVVLIASYCLSLKNPRKPRGPDLIPLKVIKFASNVTDSHLYNIIIKDLEKNKYSEEPKIAWVKPIFKVTQKNKIGNYRSISILNKMSYVLWKMYSNFISPYKKILWFKSCLIKTSRKLEKKCCYGSLQGFWLYFPWFTFCKASYAFILKR